MHNPPVLVQKALIAASAATRASPPEQSDVAARRLALLQLAVQLGSVAEACRLMGFSRGTFYRMKQRYDARGEAGLRELDRRGRIPKNRLDPGIEALVVELALAHPTWGRRRFVALLAERGITISASGIRLVWKRHGLLRSRARFASTLVAVGNAGISR
jgi:transposase